MSERVIKVARQVQAAVGKELTNPKFRRYLLTVTGVDLSKDFRYGTIWISSVSTVDEEEILEALKHHKPEFQKILSKELSSKYTPRLSFRFDKSKEHVETINKYFK